LDRIAASRGWNAAHPPSVIRIAIANLTVLPVRAGAVRRKPAASPAVQPTGDAIAERAAGFAVAGDPDNRPDVSANSETTLDNASPIDCGVLLQARGNVRKEICQIGTDSCHRTDCGDGDQGGDQSVFNCRGAVFVLQQSGERRRQIVHRGISHVAGFDAGMIVPENLRRR
jgi:hypothetical protein